MSNTNQNHTGEEKYFGDDEYMSEEESTSSFLDDEEEEVENNGKTVLQTIPREQIAKEMKNEAIEEQRETREKEFKIISEDLQEEADSSSNNYLSDELFDPKYIKTDYTQNNNNESDQNSIPRSISSMRERLEKRNEKIEERIKERRRRREHHENPSDSLLGRRRRECTKEYGSLSSADSHDEYKDNDFKDKRKIRLEHREARRIAKEKRRQARLERREERLQHKLDKKTEKLENEIHRH